MQDLKNVSLADLVDLLCDETAYYIKLINDGSTPRDQFERSREFIIALQLEIDQRNGKWKSDSYRMENGK